jgi:hypothetical protein
MDSRLSTLAFGFAESLERAVSPIDHLLICAATTFDMTRAMHLRHRLAPNPSTRDL